MGGMDEDSDDKSGAVEDSGRLTRDAALTHDAALTLLTSIGWEDRIWRLDQLAEHASVLLGTQPEAHLYLGLIDGAIARRRSYLEEAEKAPGIRSSKTKPEYMATDRQRMQIALTQELREDAKEAGIEWAELLDRAKLTNASRSRLNNNLAGLATIAKVREALEEAAPNFRHRAPSSDALSLRDTLDDILAGNRDLEPLPGLTAKERKRRAVGPASSALTVAAPSDASGPLTRQVIVETERGRLFYGTCSDSDESIAAGRRVGVTHCAEIKGSQLSAAAIAAGAVGDTISVGRPAPRVLLLGVFAVYDCSAAAARMLDGLANG